MLFREAEGRERGTLRSRQEEKGLECGNKHQINAACTHPLPHLVLGFETQGQGPRNRLQMGFWMSMLNIRGDWRDF